MFELKQKYAHYFHDRKYLISLASALIIIAISLVINFYAGVYATDKASNSVNDIILDNIPVFDVDGSFIYGPFFLWAFIVALCAYDPKKIPFVLKCTAVFIIIRSVFISLTHIGPYPDQIYIDYTMDLIKNFTFGGDLFFSGHTGLPFLMSLIFWKNFYTRLIFIGASIYFGIIVLLAHLHYSIDVLSAFFITYTIYHIAVYLFNKDFEVANEEPLKFRIDLAADSLTS